MFRLSAYFTVRCNKIMLNKWRLNLIKWTEIIEIKCYRMNNEIKCDQIIVIIGKSMNNFININIIRSLFFLGQNTSNLILGIWDSWTSNFWNIYIMTHWQRSEDWSFHLTTLINELIITFSCHIFLIGIIRWSKPIDWAGGVGGLPLHQI